MKKALLFLGIFITFNLQGQIINTNDRILPKGFAPGEEEMMRDYINSIHSRSLNCINSAPNATSVRTLAEWEELQAVVITWDGFSSILTEIVRQCKRRMRSDYFNAIMMQSLRIFWVVQELTGRQMFPSLKVNYLIPFGYAITAQILFI